MTCDCRARLLQAAADLLAQADRPRNRPQARFTRQRATCYAAAAGYLTRATEQHMPENTITLSREIERDRYGRPLVIPPGGGPKVAYRRATTFVGALEDTWALGRWQQRMVAIGLADRPDLLLSVAAHRDDKTKLDALCSDAAEAARAHAAATTGTALHTLTAAADLAQPLPNLPDTAAADLAAYRRATAGISWLAVEAGVVLDELKVHGTPDRVGREAGRVKPRIFDIKTGSIDYGMPKIAMQLAVYAHGQLYDPASGERSPLDVDLDRAVVVHLPAGAGRVELVEVDIAAGWEGVQLCRQVWAWRARKHLTRPLRADLFTLIAAATDDPSLRALYAEHRAQWTDAHTAAVKTRLAALAATAA